MVQREQVTEERGRRWISGAMTSDEYFRDARRKAHEQARKTLAERLNRPGRLRPADS